jgi:hypothetical protein
MPQKPKENQFQTDFHNDMIFPTVPKAREPFYLPLTM